jgi:MFS transporter, ACS family, allantoate permease
MTLETAKNNQSIAMGIKTHQGNTELSTVVSDKLAAYDARLIEFTDEETDRQAHLGIDEQVHLTPEEIALEKALLRKIDLNILPLLMVTYGLQYSDKITLSSGVAFGLQADTNLVGNDFAWLSTGFYLAYLCAEYPFGWVMQRFPIERVLALTVFGWSVCIFGLAACQNFTQRGFRVPLHHA